MFSLSLLSRSTLRSTFRSPPLRPEVVKALCFSLIFISFSGFTPRDYVFKSEPIWWRSLLLICCMFWLVVSRRRWLFCSPKTMGTDPGLRLLGVYFSPLWCLFFLSSVEVGWSVRRRCCRLKMVAVMLEVEFV